jgi:hypothetical protein
MMNLIHLYGNDPHRIKKHFPMKTIEAINAFVNEYKQAFSPRKQEPNFKASYLPRWKHEEIKLFKSLVKKFGNDYKKIAPSFPNKLKT